MSQHFITEFVNRTYVFKPFSNPKLVSHRIKKYQASNRKNNVSPQLVAENTHAQLDIKVKRTKAPPSIDEKPDKHIDITI